MASLQDAAFFCIHKDKLSEENRTVYSALCITFATLGLCGSIWQIFRWKPLLRGLEYRRKPSPNALVILSLAVADLLACTGVIARGVAMLVTQPPLEQTDGRLTPRIDSLWLGLGYTVEAWNQYFYGVTYMWTLFYAVDIYMQLSFKKTSYSRYIICAWIVPLTVTLGSFLAVVIHDDFPRSCASGVNLIVHYSFYYLFILIVIVANPVLFFITGRLVKQRVHESGMMSSQNRSVMLGLQRKFLSVVIIFTICWLPNVIDSILHIVFQVQHTSETDMSKYFPLWALEAVLNPLQGLFNCFLYSRHVLFHHGHHQDTNSAEEESVNENTPILYRSDISHHCRKETYT